MAANTISVPSGTTSFSTLYSLNSSLSVQIQASLNASTGLATWTFTSIDPSTGLPPTDPTVGFLPPDVDGIEGQGSVLFNVMPLSSLTTGTQISNTANVVFDSNAAISTPTWLNTLDVDAPVSAVTALPGTEYSTAGQATFNVSWSGTDVGSGVANYTIYVSINGGAFTPWLVQTTSSTAAYTGTASDTYGFYSIATDAAGNIEASKTEAEASTQVIEASSTTVLTASSQSVSAGAPVTLTATVTGPSGSTIVPTGTVTFMLGAATLGSEPLNAAGVAQLVTSTLPIAANAITAVYSGDSNYSGSNAIAITVTVTLGTSQTALISSASSAQIGSAVTLTATISVPSGSIVVPTGTVTFMLGTTDLGSEPLNGSGVAQLITTSLPGGADAITAVYSGDSNYSGSTSGSVTVTVTLIPTATMLATSAASANLGASITLTTTVTSASGTPGGTVTFMDGTAQLGTGTLNASGVATYSTTSLAAGMSSITADYGGAATYAPSASTPVSETITAPSFTVSFNPSTLTVTQGSSGTTALTVTPVGGFIQQISFSCSGLPTYATCAFSPATLTPSGGTAVSTTLTIATDVSTAALDRTRVPPRSNPQKRGALFAAVGLGLIALLRARRRAKPVFGLFSSCIIALLLAISLVFANGCGGSGQQDKTPIGSSTVTVTASGGSALQTASITVSVQQ